MMGRATLMCCLCSLTFSLLLSLVTNSAATTSPYIYQPRIVVQNGHLEIVGAEGRNVSLRTSIGGFVNLNGENLVHLVTQAKAASAIVENLRASGLINSDNSVNELQNTLSSLEELSHRVVLMENQVANLTYNSTGGPSMNSSNMRRLRLLMRKVNRLNTAVNNIMRLIVQNECSSTPCMNGGTCDDMFNDVMCHCPVNWGGKYCQSDVDECSLYTGTALGCQNGATCVNKPGSYECHCSPGWFGIHCTQKSDNCSSSSVYELCGHGICVSQSTSSGGYTCICDQGWKKENGGNACTVDIDECSGNIPACSHDPPVPCINIPGSFVCGSCPQGYSGSGYYCTDVDECLVNNGGCSINPYVPCRNTKGSRVCGPCPPGYIGDGIHCSFVGMCQINNGGCHPLSRCIENPRISQSYVECICHSGYTGNGLGPMGCMPISPTINTGGLVIADPCASHPCRNGGSCRAVTSTTSSCICPPQFTGHLCEARINPCHSNPCQNGGTCLASNDLNAFTCQCSQDYTGDFCQTQQQACGGVLRGSSGMLKFPAVNSLKYAHSTNCAWRLVTNSSKVINITFTKFDIEMSSSCQYDWLQIHDGHGPVDHLIGRFCGTTLPMGGNVVSSHNSLYLWFRSDHSVSHDGFELLWNSTDPVCGGRIESDSHGAIQSPGSPGKYPPDRDCYWELIVPLGKRIQINFFTLQIEAHDNCSYDFLEVRDGLDPTSPLLEKYCNSTVPPPLTTSGSHALLYFHSDESASDYGFQLTFSTVPGNPGCGGLWTTPTGEIHSPNSPRLYSHNAICQWLIRLPIGEKIKITFTSFQLEESVLCKFDSLEIRDGSDETSPLIARLCGRTMPRPYISTGNVMFLQFNSDASVNDEGFHLKYETLCGGEYTALNGVIHSPYYPELYPGNKECTYIISLPVGYAIKLEFQDFVMETSRQCTFDYLQIHDGDNENSTLLGKFCDNEGKGPPPIISTLNHLWLKFKTDASVHRRGFMANYTAIELLCGGIFRSQHGVITSPIHPDSYPPNVDCVWIIRGEPGTVVQLTWQSFSLERHESCLMDYVKVFDNSSIGNGSHMGTYCGNTLPPILTSVENTMTIIFHSDVSISYDGFSAQYSIIDASSVCGGTYYSTIGYLQSPNYPNNYPENQDCTWIIHVPTGQQIVLNATDFELENTENCNYDYLEIRNGGHATSPLIGRYCNGMQQRITSMSNQLFLRFVSDSSVPRKGFKILWDGTTFGCGGSLTAPRGSIVSPNYPHNYGVRTECIWRISVSKGSRISLVFVDLDLEVHSSCRYDYLEIRDGYDSRGKVLGKYCSSDHPLHLTSTENNLWIKFRSDENNQGRGFHLRYLADCNTVLTGQRGVIESPNFPDPYPQSLNCSWTLTAPQGNRLNISFSHFDLEDRSGAECNYDYLEISDGPKNEPSHIYGKYCGRELPEPISSSFATIHLRLTTDPSVSGRGFRLEWVVNGCGGLLTKPSGQFTSPGFPNSYPLSTECVWHVRVEWNNSIELNMHSLDLEKSPRCIYDSIKIYGGPYETSPLLTNVCHYQQSSLTVTSSGNNMLVVFRSDSSFSGRGFEASYKSVPLNCGGNFSSPTGNIHSRNYPQNYENKDECFWFIKVDKNYIIKLTFIEFDVEGFGNCSADYVNVFDGETDSDRMLLHHCGSRLPSPSVLYSTGNTMLVRMRTDSSIPAKGFMANYSVSCGAHIVVKDEGMLVPTGDLAETMLELRSRLSNCTWILEGENLNDQITLTFLHMDMSLRENDENCSLFYVEVRDGNDQNAPLIGRYCASRVPHHITSTGSSLFIIYSYVYYSLPNAFRISYSVLKTACGGDLTSEHGAFATPGIPGSYPGSAECIWTINASPGNRAMVSFRSFDLELSDNCDRDYVEIRTGNSTGTLMGVYCGNAIPDNITASETFWIKFRSDEDGTGLGFVADYSLLHGNDLSGSEGLIASPLFPHSYIYMGQFSWRITVMHGKAISITFDEFYLETYHEDCSYFIKIHDGYDETAPVLYEGCGYEKPPAITSSSNVVNIVWETDFIRIGSWFLLRWLEVPLVPVTSQLSVNTTTIPGCGGLFDVEGNGTEFTSPGYPSGYDKNLNCSWIFETVPYKHLRIAIQDMNLQESPYCSRSDSLEIYDGMHGHQEWKHLKSLCLSNASREVPLEGSNVMKAVFKSDSYVNGTGFSAVVIPVCGGSLKGPNGVIDALNLTTNDAVLGHPLGYYFSCEWNITVKPGRTIVVEFDTFNIYSSNDVHCGSNYLLFRNGGTASSPYLGDGKYCGSSAPDIPETSGNLMNIKYRAYSGTKGFKLRFREKSLSCGSHIIMDSSTESYEISSPNYPNIPPSHVECEWILLAPIGERISLHFIERFDVTTSVGCSKAYVEVRDGGTQNSELIGRYCTEMPGTQSSTGNILYVKFFTDADEPRNGFKANATLETCGGIIRSQRGSVTSPSFPSHYSQNIFCKWKIVTAPDKRIIINFDVIDLPISQNCSGTDHVTITEKVLVLPTVSSSSPTTTTPNPRTLIYDEYEYPEYFEEIGSNTLPAVSSNEYKTRVLAKVCGFSPVAAIEASSNEVEVEFKTLDNPHNFRGFRLTFETSQESCGGPLQGMPSGVIESPGYPRPSARNRLCVWRITVPQGRRIRMEIQDLDLAGSPTFCTDRVAFFNGLGFSSIIKWFCGTIPPIPVESSSNTMTAYFWTRHASNHRGFKATYSSDLPSLCEGDLNAPSGIITSRNIVNRTSFTCEWERKESSPSNYTFSMTLMNSQIGVASTYCRYSSTSLKITYGDSGHLDDFCGNYTTPVIVNNPYRVTKIVALQSPLRHNMGGPNNFTLHYSVSECGGVLTGPSEVITSPNFPQDYPANINCAWALNYPEGQQIRVKFQNMSLERDCLNDYVQIRNGRSPKSPRIGVYCGDVLPPEIQSGSNKLWITFHSNALNQAPGFKLIAEAATEGCGGIMNRNNGVLQSPNYPKQYDNNIECQWELNAQEGYHIGLQFIDRFQLEGGGKCDKDYVEVFNYANESWVSLGRVCGRNIPPSFNSTGYRMKVLFHSNNMTKGDGFKAKWNINCGGVLNNERGVLTSPGYPNQYANNLHCEYVINSPGNYITAEFQHFNIETEPTCIYDNLTIYLMETRSHFAPKQLGPYCGTDIPPFLRGADTMRFIFRTDSWVQKTGFVIKYKTETCGGFMDSPGIIQSPTAESTYFGGLNCTWVIQAPLNQVVLLEFHYFNLERSGTCSFDSVSVFDGPVISNDKALARLCGNLDDEPPVMKSTTTAMVVQFKTDTSVHLEGFKASVSFTYGEASGCGGTKRIERGSAPLQLSQPNVRSVGHYEPFLDCHWLIIGPPSEVLNLEFKTMDLTPCNISTNSSTTSTVCGCDFIEARDGAGPFSGLIGRYCGSTIPGAVSTSSNKLWLRFKSDAFGNGRGFQVDVKSIESPCGPSSVLRVTNVTQILKSPNYPNHYPNSLRCRWLLTSNETQRFDIHFQHMDIEDSKGCENDWLDMHDTMFSDVITEGLGTDFVYRGQLAMAHPFLSSRIPTQRSKFCGTGHPTDFYSGTNNVAVEFITNHVNTGQGFQLAYRLEGCNRNFTGVQGRILNSRLLTESNCIITIQAQPNHTISLYFSEFFFGGNQQDCATAGMRIRDGLSDNSPVLQTVCGMRSPDPIFSTSSALSITIWSTLEWRSARYDMTYTTTDKGRGCGGRLFNYGGKFTSPLYPMNLRNETSCRWEVAVPQGSVVTLAFQTFDLGQRSTCETDYLSIYDFDSYTNEEIFRTKYCGTDNPANYQGSSNVVIVQYVTSVNNAGTGWVIQFSATKQGTVP